MSQVDSPLRAQRKLRCARELVGALGKDMSSPLLGAGSREVGCWCPRAQFPDQAEYYPDGPI